MPFDYDIFISYGHLDDNKDATGGDEGWVDLLVKRLPGQVARHLGYEPTIWRDEEALQGNDRLWPAIESGIRRSLLLVPVLSPRYVRSAWCPRELETFCSSEPPEGEPPGSFRSRIFKVVKTPPLLGNLSAQVPPSLRDLLGYEFYKMEGGMPREFSPDTAGGKDQRYWDMLDRLAWQIAISLARLKPAPGAAAAPPAGPTKFVYLAETTSDLADQRERVRDELLQRGYGVLPERKLPVEGVESTRQAASADLARCELSVHMVGARYGSTPEESELSVVMIQAELAAERGTADPNFRCLLWMPPALGTPEMPVTNERQKSFIEGLQKWAAPGTELLQKTVTIEDLKTRIVEKLNPPRQAADASRRRGKSKHVYLIFDERDWDLVEPIQDYLIQHDLEVIAGFDESGGESLMKNHHRCLTDCDAALIYFGSGDEFWVRKYLDDVADKAYGYGREEDWRASGVYVGAPPDRRKLYFKTPKVPFVIRSLEGFDPGKLSEFVAAVRADG